MERQQGGHASIVTKASLILSGPKCAGECAGDEGGKWKHVWRDVGIVMKYHAADWTVVDAGLEGDVTQFLLAVPAKTEQVPVRLRLLLY